VPDFAMLHAQPNPIMLDSKSGESSDAQLRLTGYVNNSMESEIGEELHNDATANKNAEEIL
jgi:hypothetical protein